MELETLQDLYSAENQIIKALPKMAKAATNPRLVAGFKTHLTETKEHATRLERILKSHGESTRGPKCKGMEGVIKEGAEMIEEDAEDDVRDAGLISAAQRVEHYEMAGYGTARTYATILGDGQAVKLLQKTLDEEGATDKKLTKLASTINIAASLYLSWFSSFSCVAAISQAEKRGRVLETAVAGRVPKLQSDRHGELGWMGREHIWH